MSYMANYEYGLGTLVKMEDVGAYRYDAESDCWIRWEYGDAMKWGQGPFMDYDDISDEEAAFLRYKLRVAYILTQNYGNSFHNGANVERVRCSMDYVEAAFAAGDEPWDCAIEIGYNCG